MSKMSLITNTKQYLLLFSVYWISLQAHAQKVLDNLSNQPTAAYSTRLMSSSYTGPAMQIRRCSDDQLVDVYFDVMGKVSLSSKVSVANGGLASEISLREWINDVSAYVMIWYDQSGNGNNATQTILNYQPRIINTGIIEELPNGIPTLRMLRGATGGNGFNLPFNLLNANNINVFVSVRQDGNTSIGNHLFGTSGPTGITPGKLQMHYFNTSQLGMQSSVVYGSSRLPITPNSFVNARYTIDEKGTGQISMLSKEGGKLTGLLSTELDGTMPTLFRIGSNTYARSFEGVSPEFIYYSSPISVLDANEILSNQNNTFSQSSPISLPATDLKTDGFKINWAIPEGSLPSSTFTYSVQYSTSQDFSSGNILLPNISSNQISRVITGLNANTNYWYRVMLNVSGSGDSGWSEVQSIKTLTVLPITLIDFNVNKIKNGGVNLLWKTLSEVGNDYFEIQRSIDGDNFSFIGKVYGNGNSLSVQNYNFIDKNPSIGFNYYRLKQVDFNGDFSLSNIKLLDYKIGSLAPIIYPNPGDNILNVNMNGLLGDFDIEIHDLTSKLILRTQYRNEAIDIYDLVPGVYILEIIDRINRNSVSKNKFLKLKFIK